MLTFFGIIVLIYKIIIWELNMANILDMYSEEVLLENIENEQIDIEREEGSLEDVETPPNRKLYIDKVDKSTSDIIRMIKEGELNLQPDYQRRFVWNTKTQSQFIESLLLSIPIPTIFLAENDDETFEVIDGQQRLTTVFAFYKSVLFEEDLKQFNVYDETLLQMDALKLTGLETLSDLNKLKFNEMNDKIQRRFKNVSLPMVIIQKDSSEDIKYDIFSRINQGSIKLNGQELLNVMYRGEFLKKLNEICELDEVDNIFGKRPVLKKRFGYNEILLRSFILSEFVDNDWSIVPVKIKQVDKFEKEKKERKYGGRLNSAITEFLKEFRDDVAKGEELERFLLDSIEKVRIVFGSDAFKRIDNKDLATSINKTIAEVQLVTLSRFSMDKINNNKEKIKNSFRDFLLREDNTELFLRGTNNTSNFTKRYTWGRDLAKELED